MHKYIFSKRKRSVPAKEKDGYVNGKVARKKTILKIWENQKLTIIIRCLYQKNASNKICIKNL